MDDFNLAQTLAGLVHLGNVDLTNRPVVQNTLPGEGGLSTIRSMSYLSRDGTETLIPTVSNEGQIMPDRDAANYWAQRGQFLGKFTTPKAADDYGQMLHNDQAALYLR